VPRGPKKRLGRTPATDSEETRRRIVETAQQCFGELGYEKATNNDIADRIGLTSGSIYHHFGAKSELYLVVCEHAAVLILDRLEKATALKQGFVDKLIAVLDAAIELNREQPSLSHFLVNASSDARRYPELAPGVEHCMGGIAGFLARLVEEGTAAGEISPGTSPESVVGLMQALVLGLGQFATMAPLELHTAVMVECERMIAGTLFKAPAAVKTGGGKRRAVNN
jgi:TetR/AcrR family transcriptional regulator, repressor for uid operon